ncbi:MAG: hypothetical protein AAF607_13625 [Pseudomonadota bacterium]
MSSLSALAQPDAYQPDILALDGNTLARFAPAGGSMIRIGSAVDLWLQPDWDRKQQNADAVILACLGDADTHFVLALSADQQALLLVTGAREWSFDFNFADAQMHHVALQHFVDGSTIMIDGALIGETEVPIFNASAPATWLGGLPAADGMIVNGFHGALAALRLWRVVPSRAVMMQQALNGVFETAPGSLLQLTALSDFAGVSLADASLPAAPAMLLVPAPTSRLRGPAFKSDFQAQFPEFATAADTAVLAPAIATPLPIDDMASLQDRPEPTARSTEAKAQLRTAIRTAVQQRALAQTVPQDTAQQPSDLALEMPPETVLQPPPSVTQRLIATGDMVSLSVIPITTLVAPQGADETDIRLPLNPPPSRDEADAIAPNSSTEPSTQ